jgi:hypothetical protein
VVGEGVPVDLATPVDHLTATLEADEAAVNRLIDVQGVEGDLAFGDGTVGYSGSTRFLGLRIEYSVTAEPTAAGDTVLLQPVGVEVGAGGGSLDVSGIVERLLGDDPVPRVRRRPLPEGVEVQQITVEPSGATVVLEGERDPPRRRACTGCSAPTGSPDDAGRTQEDAAPRRALRRRAPRFCIARRPGNWRSRCGADGHARRARGWRARHPRHDSALFGS